jgi:hypothetical protein
MSVSDPDRTRRLDGRRAAGADVEGVLEPAGPAVTP